jgi:hypothetical protein
MKLFHGSPNLFDRADPTFMREGINSSENGHGFNMASHRETPWGKANGLEGGPGVVYSVEFDEARLEKWLVSTETLSQRHYDAIIAGLSRYPDQKKVDDIRKTLRPGMPVFSEGEQSVASVLDLRTRNIAKFLSGVGIEGYHRVGEDTYVFFDAHSVPPLSIDFVVGDFPEAKEALNRQKQTGVFALPRIEYWSEELRMAASDVRATRNPGLVQAFNEFTELATSPAWRTQNPNGFSLRNNFGLAIQRLLRDEGDLTDHYSGLNTFKRTADWLHSVPGSDDIVKKAEAVKTAILKSFGRAP